MSVGVSPFEIANFFFCSTFLGCSSGQGAYLLESTEKANSYKLNVGNLPPNQKAEVHVEYSSPLAPTHDGFIFTLPPTLFPKTGTYACSVTGTIDMGEEVSQVTVLSGHGLKQYDVSGFRWTNEDQPISGLGSEIQLGIKLKSMESARESTNEGTQELTKPKLIIENDFLTDPTLFSAMLDFRPSFASSTPEFSSDYEVVVLADCTGAMYGHRMQKQQNALKLLVHSLPSGCKFNLIAVQGENYTSQWRTSVVLDEENLTNAIYAIERLGVFDPATAPRYVRKCGNASYAKRNISSGEPRFLAAFNSVYGRRDYLRNLCVFLLTAIDYTEESRALNKIVTANASRNSRLFCMGLGDEVDAELLHSLAFSGRGKSSWVKDDESVDAALFQQLVAAFAPRVRDIKVTWNVDEEAKSKFLEQAPRRVPITASGATTSIYALFEVPVPEGCKVPTKEEIEKQIADSAASSDSIANATGSKSSSPSISKQKIGTGAKDKVAKSSTKEKLPRASSAAPGSVVSGTVSNAMSKGSSSTDVKAASTSEQKDQKDQKEQKEQKEGDSVSASSSSSTTSPKIPRSHSTAKASKGEKVSSSEKKTSSSASIAPKAYKPPQVNEVLHRHQTTLLEGLKLPIKSVTIEGVGPGDVPLKWEIQASEATFRGLSRTVTSTAASKVCSEYTNHKDLASVSAEEAKNKTISISTKFQVISKYTSFIAVEERRGDSVDGAMKTVNMQSMEDPNSTAPIEAEETNIIVGGGIIHRHPVAIRNQPNRLPPPPPPPSNAPGGAPPHAQIVPSPLPQGCRHILPRKNWMPPQSGQKPVHSLPEHTLSIQSVADDDTYFSSFNSEKAKRKKSEKEKSGAVSNFSADFSSTAREFTSSTYTSTLGFAVEIDPHDDQWSEDPYTTVLKQAPAKYRLTAPTASPRGASPAYSSRSVASESKSSKDAKLASGGGASKKRDRREEGQVPPSAPSHHHIAQDDAEHSSDAEDEDVGNGEMAEKNEEINTASQAFAPSVKSLPSKSPRSVYDNDAMVPNRSGLAPLTFGKALDSPHAPPPPPKDITLSLARPEGWDYAKEILQQVEIASPNQQNNVEFRLKTIIGTQRADGSWSAEMVCKMLKFALDTLKSSNPIASPKEGAETKEGKKEKRKHKQSESEANETNAEAPESQDKSSNEKSDAPSAESKAVEGEEIEKKTAKISNDDLWASIIVFAHLKAHFDAERTYWTFLALKFEAMLQKNVEDAKTRKSYMKQAKSFLDTLPQ